MRALRLKTTSALIAIAALAAACTPPASPPKPAEPPVSASDPLMDKAKSQGFVRVIARLQAPDSQLLTGQALLAAQTAAVSRMQALGAPAQPLSARFPLIAADVDARQLAAMRTDPGVAAITEDVLAFPSLAQSGPLVGAPAAFKLGATGKGQAVAILDTCVDAAHPFFGKRVTAEACFSTTSPAQRATSACPNGQSEMIGAGAAKPCAATGCDHGTHVAGIAAGRGANFSGTAPEAEIVAVQVFSVFDASACGGLGRAGPCVASFTSDQIRALDYVLTLAKSRPVAAVNMSLGGGRSSGACDDDVTKLAIDDLRAAGVATVIASGNDGFVDAVSRPGCISTAVTVSATDKADAVAPFANRAEIIDLHAPGVAINSSVPGSSFKAFSGTSMAAPHVAGAIAALRSERPQASLDALEAAMRGAGAVIADPASGLTRSRLRIDAASASLAKPTEATMTDATPAAAPAPVPGVQALAALPSDRDVRVIVTLADPEGMAAAASAAQAAGATAKPLRPGLMIVEGKPAAIERFAKSGHARAVQIDARATPQ
jgi:subtilisin family serine protease